MIDTTPVLAPPIVPTTPVPKSVIEYRAFRKLLPGLLEKYRNKYVAIHEGQVVGVGDNQIELAISVQRRIGNVAIHVGLVTDEPERIYSIKGPRLISNPTKS